MKKVIRQFGHIRKSEDDNRTVKFTFSTAAEDRHRTVLNKDGWEINNFNNNGIAGYMHDVYGDGLLAKPDPDDVIGKARAWVEGDNLVGEITFEPKDLNEKADKVYRKIQFGSLNAVSVGFVERGTGERDKESGIYKFAGQELLEISVVNIPSNPEALKQRDFQAWNEINNDLEEVIKSINNMDEKKEDLVKKTEVEVKVNAEAFDAAVTKLGEKVDKLVESIETKNIPGPVGADLSNKDKRDLGKFSIAKAILHYAKGGDKALEGIELEMHQEAANELRAAGNLSLNGLGIPTIATRADLKATVDASGGYTVATDLVGFIPTLRDQMVVLQAGAKMLPGLVGDVGMPRRATDSTATWRTEGGIATQSDPTYEQVTMKPHRLTNYTEFTQQLLRQSSINIENEVRDTLFYGIARALEVAALSGSGTSQVPAGLINTTGVNDADHGSNGTILSWNNLVKMETMVAEDNGLSGKLAYITNSTIAGKMKTTLKNTYQGGYLWEMFTPLTKGMVNGYDAYISNTISNAVTRGTNSACSYLFFGNWEQLLIGQWGGLDLLINPYSLDTYGTIRVVVAGYFDIAVKQPKAFAAMAGIEN